MNMNTNNNNNNNDMTINEKNIIKPEVIRLIWLILNCILVFYVLLIIAYHFLYKRNKINQFRKRNNLNDIDEVKNVEDEFK